MVATEVNKNLFYIIRDCDNVETIGSSQIAQFLFKIDYKNL